jgi:hypothetical protein
MKLVHFPLGGDFAAAAAGFLLALAPAGAAAFLLDGGPRGRVVEQPLRFNHRVHVEGEGLECSTCHMFYETETWSGMPSAAICSLCHMEMQGESAAEEALVALLEEGAEPSWGALFRQPNHVFFSHRRHVVAAGLECVTCHGAIGSSEAPPRRAAPLPMTRCVECHEADGASSDCSACHR